MATTEAATRAQVLNSGSARKAIVILSVLFGVVCVISTYRIYNHTWDEPLHIAAGVELLDRGEYTFEPQHPPIARIAFAIGPYLMGARSGRHETHNPFADGRRILHETADYQTTLMVARLGNLPFYLLTLVATWLLAAHLFNREVAALSVFFLATIPPLTGNAAMAALDIAPTGLGILALYLFVRWLEAPARGRACLLGAACAAAILTKYSALPFLAVAFAAVLVGKLVMARRDPARPGWLGASHFATDRYVLLGSLPVCFAASLFLFGPLVSPDTEAGGPATLAGAIAALPIYPLFLSFVPAGLIDLMEHNQSGHTSYLLGEIRDRGWWYYYVVGLVVRTPLPVLLAGLTGLGWAAWSAAARCRWQGWVPILAFAAILIFASAFSAINIGLRHVFLLYPLLAIGAGFVLFRLTVAERWRWPALALAVAIAGGQLASALRAHPDHLTYFNALAGDKPEAILVKGDLDWGQDFNRLKRAIRMRGIDRIALSINGSVDPARHTLPDWYELPTDREVTGWVAISLQRLLIDPEIYGWLNRFEPVERVGQSINLYYIPDPAG